MVAQFRLQVARRFCLNVGEQENAMATGGYDSQKVVRRGVGVSCVGRTVVGSERRSFGLGFISPGPISGRPDVE